MHWNKLRVFYFVAKTGGFTNAALHLNVSQSAVSRSIINLEQQIKITLFKRKSRGIELTREGQYLFQVVQKMNIETEKAIRQMRGYEDQAKGELKVNATHSLTYSWLVPHIKGFIDLYPDIRLTLTGHDEKVDLLQADSMLHPYIQGAPDLVQQYIHTFHIGLFASPDYIAKFGMPEKPEDLDYHQLITFGDETLHPYVNVNWSLRAGANPRKKRESFMKVNSSHGLLKAAVHGLGIVELGIDHPKLENVELIRILPHLETPKIDIYYIYPEYLKNSKRVTCLGEYLENLFAQQKKVRNYM